ncbi:2'-5' RNA ligase family protein [Streptomyces sp. NPDC007088]|uniref:2'-5' RNA ligase family protein n=1 Tax=Streptomyces sp. NPDC007088 TaxID=3364773 RepID=UPI00369CAD75
METRGEPARSAGADDAEGWGDRPGDTALTLRVPEADSLVTAGFPAHVTLLYPFVHESRLVPGARRELARLCRAHPAFTLRFARFGRYPGVLYLEPEPHEPVLALRAALRERWPEAVPYRGLFGPGGLPPHLTLAHHERPGTYPSAYDALERRYAEKLPLCTRVAVVHLIVRREGAWQDADVLPLGP